MGIYLKWRGDRLSPQWWGFWQADGKRHEVAICKWRGSPPPKGAGKHAKGDAEFERSREEAELEFKKLTSPERSEADRAVLVQRIHAVRYGGKVERVRLDKLTEKWDALPGKDRVTEARRERVHSVLVRFSRFMQESFPGVTEVGALTAEHFKGFFNEIDESGVSARTWNDYLDILRGVLRKVDAQSKGFRDYLDKLPKRTQNTVHRRPFTDEELRSIFDAAAAVDPELRPVLVTAACTALRRGDVAQLRWEDVDMDAGFVTIKTSKTGETVEIPVFRPLAEVLIEATRTRRPGVPYVFPNIARAYQAGPDSLDRRLRKVLAAAGFVTPNKVNDGDYPAPSTPADAVAKVNAGMVAGRWSEARRQKGLAILKRHLEGQDGKTIAREMGIARGAVSAYLHEMEDVGRVALVSPALPVVPRKATLAEFREGEKRKQRGSLCGWHSFRTTFCSLALANGVSMDTLRRVTGHRTAEIVEKYYNQAKREQARRAFREVMPKALVGMTASPEPATSSVEDLVAVPADVARLAEMFAGATPEQIAMVEKVLKRGAKKGGGK